MFHIKEMAWFTLDAVANWYRGVDHALRRQYRWTPFVVDAIPVDRLIRIVADLMDDVESKKDGYDEEEFE